MRSSLGTSPQAGSAFHCCTRGLRVGFTNPNSCSGLCFSRWFSLVVGRGPDGIHGGAAAMAPTPPHSSFGHVQRNLLSAEQSRHEPVSCALEPNTVQSPPRRSTIMARPLTRMSSEKRCYLEVQKTNRAYRDLQGLLLNQIQQEYAKTPKSRASRQKCLPSHSKCPAHPAICRRGILITSRLGATAVSF